MKPPVTHIVDDDAAVRDALSWLLKTHGIEAVTWASAEDFLDNNQIQACACLVLDIRMPGMSGIELFDVIRKRGCDIPVIFLTGHGDVPVAVQAIKDGAFDFLEKPVDDRSFVERIRNGLTVGIERANFRSRKDEVMRTLAELTPREKEVMDCILAGKMNKVIADDLGIAMRTVEVHRSRVFEKMKVRSAVELSQLLASFS
jgi:two-component system response regulator DctR